MLKDIFDWAENVMKMDKVKVAEIKRSALQKNENDIQTFVNRGLCTKGELIQAVKMIYGMDTFQGSINDLKPIKEIPLSVMMDNGFLVVNHPTKLREYLVLLLKPQSKLSVYKKIESYKVNAKLTIMFMFTDDFEEWKKVNKTFLNDTRINKVVSNIEVAGSSQTQRYDANEEELNSESITGIVNKIILEAVEEHASDIHIEPCEQEIKIRFRVDGLLKIHSTIDNKAVHSQIVNRIKVLAKMDTNNFMTPQSGKINMSILDKEVDMRISTLPSIFGEKVTIRILVSQNVKIRTLEELGIKAELAEQLRFIAAHPHGIIVVSGPTGSGKSSTLASLLTEMSDVEKCLVTIEDPVEYKIPGATQVNIHEAVGLTFASVLREVLRQDPDIIMVGEVRDVETAKTAVTASNTGHLVFSTIHTNGAVATITRLADMGVDHYMIADSLIGILSQRLIKVLCPHCKKPHVIDEDDQRKYKLPKSMIGKQVYEACGCINCNGGYTGRTIVPEILEITEPIKRAIHSKESSQVIEELALKQGMVKQHNYAYKLVLEGKTSLKEVFRIYGGVQDEEVDS